MEKERFCFYNYHHLIPSINPTTHYAIHFTICISQSEYIKYYSIMSLKLYTDIFGMNQVDKHSNIHLLICDICKTFVSWVQIQLHKTAELESSIRVHEKCPIESCLKKVYFSIKMWKKDLWRSTENNLFWTSWN